jgi:hypothetical protein
MSKRVPAIFAIFVMLAVAALPALAKPNFTGDWKLNIAKSTFGDIPAPDSATYKIDHADPKMTSVAKQSGQMGEIEIDVTCTTDGKECTNPGFQGAPTKSVMKWDGDALTIESKGQFGDIDFTSKERWTLSDDGKTITVAQTISSSMGEFTQKLVFEKQ